MLKPTAIALSSLLLGVVLATSAGAHADETAATGTAVKTDGFSDLFEVSHPHQMGAKAILYTAALEDGQTAGAPAHWKVKADGATVFRSMVGPQTRSAVSVWFHRGTGPHRIAVVLDGSVLMSHIVRTGH